MTTVSLLLLAMYDLLKDGVVKSESFGLTTMIAEDFLIDKYKTGDSRIKLKPVKKDCAAYNALFDEDTERERGSNLTINYDYFYSRIRERVKDGEITIDLLFDAITRLQIIDITLNKDDDNPQLIFESLNSTGLALSEGDKIRNFILMGLDVKEQNEYYEKYWSKIEVCTGYNVSGFVRDYLCVKLQTIPTISKVYFTFKEYVEEREAEVNNFDSESLLKDMLSYAKRYEILLKGNKKNDRLDFCIYRLNRLETTVTRPFLLEILRLQNEGKLTDSEVSEIFLYTENYVVRRSVCELGTNVLNKVFAALHHEIIRFDGTADNYVAKFKYALRSKIERSRFPGDEEFADAFSTRQIYLMNSKTKNYLLERLENNNTIEDKNIYLHCDKGDYSIEHIMPRNLTPA